jgi:hypothetical protein
MASSSNANASANANANVDVVDVDMSSDIEDSGPTEKELELQRQMEAEKQRRLEEAKKKKEEKRRAAEEAKRIAEEEAARKAAEEEANRKAAEEEAKRKAAERAARAAASPELREGMEKTPAEGAEQPTAPKRTCLLCTQDGEICEWTGVSIAFWTWVIYLLNCLQGRKSCEYCRNRRKRCEVPGEPKAPPRKRKRATTVSSPKGGKGKKKARQPSPESAENTDEETIGDLIATVEDFRTDMNADLAMGRAAASKRLHTLEAHMKAESTWRKTQRAQWEKEAAWRTEVMGVLGRIADSLEARNKTAEATEEDGEAEGSGAMEEEKGEEEEEKEKESTAEEDAEGENDMEVAE